MNFAKLFFIKRINNIKSISSNYYQNDFCRNYKIARINEPRKTFNVKNKFIFFGMTLIFLASATDFFLIKNVDKKNNEENFADIDLKLLKEFNEKKFPVMYYQLINGDVDLAMKLFFEQINFFAEQPCSELKKEVESIINSFEICDFDNFFLLIDRFLIRIISDKNLNKYQIIKAILFIAINDKKSNQSAFSILKKITNERFIENDLLILAKKCEQYIAMRDKDFDKIKGKAFFELLHYNYEVNNRFSLAIVDFNIDFASIYRKIEAWKKAFFIKNDKSEKIIIRVWKSNKKIKSIGHMSLQIVSEKDDQKIYASFWPKSDEEGQERQKKWHTKKGIFNSLAEDIMCKYSLPDDYIVLDGLNLEKIAHEFNRIQSIDTFWSLSASPFSFIDPTLKKIILHFIKKEPSEFYNCSTLVHHLLLTGGFPRIKIYTDQIKFNILSFYNSFIYPFSVGWIGFKEVATDSFSFMKEYFEDFLERSKELNSNSSEGYHNGLFIVFKDISVILCWSYLLISPTYNLVLSGTTAIFLGTGFITALKTGITFLAASVATISIQPDFLYMTIVSYKKEQDEKINKFNPSSQKDHFIQDNQPVSSSNFLELKLTQSSDFLEKNPTLSSPLSDSPEKESGDKSSTLNSFHHI